MPVTAFQRTELRGPSQGGQVLEQCERPVVKGQPTCNSCSWRPRKTGALKSDGLGFDY